MRTLSRHVPDAQVAVKVRRADQQVVQQRHIVATRETKDGLGAIAACQVPNLDRAIMTA